MSNSTASNQLPSQLDDALFNPSGDKTDLKFRPTLLIGSLNVLVYPVFGMCDDYLPRFLSFYITFAPHLTTTAFNPCLFSSNWECESGPSTIARGQG